MPATKAPWEWRKVGNNWVLWGAHGRRPIVLDVFKGQLRVRDHRELMVPFDPEHPDARLIEASPTLLAVLEVVVKWAASPDPAKLAGESRFIHDLARNAIAKATQKPEDQDAQQPSK